VHYFMAKAEGWAERPIFYPFLKETLQDADKVRVAAWQGTKSGVWPLDRPCRWTRPERVAAVFVFGDRLVIARLGAHVDNRVEELGVGAGACGLVLVSRLWW
jgi:hypothetical protein